MSDDESVGDVSGVVDAEPDGQDDVDAGERVDGDVPEVEEPDDVDQSEKNANLNKQQNWIIKIFSLKNSQTLI